MSGELLRCKRNMLNNNGDDESFQYDYTDLNGSIPVKPKFYDNNDKTEEVTKQVKTARPNSVHDVSNPDDQYVGVNEIEAQVGSSTSASNTYCHICKIHLFDETHLNLHIGSIHSNMIDISDFESFKRVTKSKIATKNDTADVARDYCDICNRRFSSQYYLKRHKFDIHNIGCGENLKSRFAQLAKPHNDGPHRKKKRNVDESLMGYIFGNSSLKLISDKQSTMVNDMACVQCQLCPRQFCNKYFLKKHMLHVHNPDVDEDSQNSTVKVEEIDLTDDEKRNTVRIVSNRQSTRQTSVKTSAQTTFKNSNKTLIDSVTKQQYIKTKKSKI